MTSRTTGKYLTKHVDKFFGSKPGVGTESHPYEVTLEPGVVGDSKRNETDFNFEISTLAGNNYGTNDSVYFKIFDDTGHASALHRKNQWGDQYNQGDTNYLPDFDTQFGALSKTITKVLVSKVGDNGWRPDTLIVKPGVASNVESTFDLAGHMPPGEESLDSHHNWTTAPRKDM